MEKRTFICSHTRAGAKPTPHEGIKSKLGHWMSPDDMDAKMDKDFAGCMKGLLKMSVQRWVKWRVKGTV